MSENGITHYCLGNGALKCDGCGQEKNWQTLNQMPDTLRKPLQAQAQRIDDTDCILSGRPWYVGAQRPSSGATGMTRSGMEGVPLERRVSRRARFGVDEAQAAGDAWGFNCGPGALCAVLGLTPDEVRPMMGDFEAKGYTNPTLMADVLRSRGVRHRQTYRSDLPGRCRLDFGLMRVQWAGPWTQPGAPMAARYRHTHWVAVARDEVFDINAICVGGWIGRQEWETKLVPWLIRETCPRGTGEWWPTHGWELPTQANAKNEGQAGVLACPARLEG